MTQNRALKHAFRMGVKLAYSEGGFADKSIEGIDIKPPYEDASKPPFPVTSAEDLTTSLQKLPSPKQPDNHNPNEDRDPLTTYGRSTQHWDLDDMARFGLDIQGPSMTGV